MPELRRQPRVAYHTNIRLRPADADESVVARTENLSATGMFVTAADLPAPGTDVLCRMLVAGERCTLKGKVAWMRSGSGAPRGSGAGIQFVDLDARESELLERLLGARGSEGEPPVTVDVWFEGLRAPIKSQASVSEEALSISTKLPFLRLNSPVRMSFVRRGVEEVRTGTLEAVTLEPSADDGVPRLKLTVFTPQPDHAQGTIEVPDTGTVFDPQDLMLSEPRTVVDAAAAVPARQAPARAPEPALAVVKTPTPTVDPAAPAAEARGGRDLTSRPDEAVTPAPPVPLTPSRLPRPPRAFRLALLLGTSAMVIGAAVGYRLWRGGERAAPRPAVRAQGRGTSSIPIELVPIASRSETPPPAAPTVAPRTIEPPPTVEPTPTGGSEDGLGPDGLGVTTSAEGSSILVGVVGSSKGVLSYPLANPPGVVVVLPHGRPRTPAGVHTPGLPFRKVIVGHRGGGYVVRIYFTSDQAVEVISESAGVRVNLRPKRGPRRS
jgi:Tfp pilus assembly protein PilZ